MKPLPLFSQKYDANEDIERLYIFQYIDAPHSASDGCPNIAIH